MRKAIAVLGLIAAVGCGGGDDNKPVDAVAECKESVAVASAKNADCAVATGAIAPEQRDQYASDFAAAAALALDCSRVTKILGDTDACATDTKALPCSFFTPQNGLPIPASCKGIYGK